MTTAPIATKGCPLRGGCRCRIVRLAIVVADDWRHRGPGSFLLTLLIDTACARALKRMGGDMVALKGPMTAVAKAALA